MNFYKFTDFKTTNSEKFKKLIKYWIDRIVTIQRNIFENNAYII